MRIAMAILSAACLAGCSTADKGLPEAGNPVARGEEIRSGMKDEIRQLVESSDVIVLGTITGIHDGRARGGGMSYDVKLEEQLYGKSISGDTFRFRSAGRDGYAIYRNEERVLLFLKHWQEERIQVKPVCYVSKEASRMGLTLWPLQEYLDLAEREIAKKE